MGLMGVGSAVVLLLGLFGALHPALVSVSVFRAYAVLGLLVSGVLVLLFAGKRRRWGALLILLCVGGYSQLGGAVRGLDPEGPAPLTHYHKNVLFNTSNMADVIEDIEKTKPDTVTLLEVSSVHLPELDALKTAYPVRAVCPSRGPGNTVVLARFKPLGAPICIDGSRVTAVNLAGPEGPFWAIGLHLVWPWPRGQSAQLSRILPELEALDGPKIVAGDFNMVPWGVPVDLVEGAAGTALIERSPISLVKYAGLLRVPIDHVLVTGGRGEVTRRPRFLSDHYGILARYQLGPE